MRPIDYLVIARAKPYAACRQPAVEQGLLTLNPNETVSTNHQEKALSFEFKTERQETNTLTDPPDDDSKLTPFKPPAMK
ncbi:hypothetical protein, partial [Enterovibrio norvegicus]|uniref:hypothetical protein n=1 Tax=Enterovibrio norvegicus TaxID=188144 RepID=UPI001A7E1AD0